MNKPVSLYVPPETMADVNAGERFAYSPPADAAQKGVGENASFSWMELIAITGSEIAFDEKNPQVAVFTIKTKIPDDTPYPTNVGRMASFRWRINTESMKTRDANDGQYKMSKIAVGRLKGIARACGFPVTDGEGWDPVPVFDSNGPDSPSQVTGARLYIKLVDKPGEYEGEKIRNVDAQKFLSEADGTA